MRWRKIRFDFQQKILSRLVFRRQILKFARINGTKTKKRLFDAIKKMWLHQRTLGPMKVISIKTSIRLRQRRPALTFQEKLLRITRKRITSL